MKALILAAGYATRLYPYTKNFPKPLLEIDNKPIIEYLVEKLNRLDCFSEIIIVTNARFYSHFEKWKKNLKYRGKIRLINDLTRNSRDRLGAVGDMNLVFNKAGCDDDYLVIGGDNFFQEALSGFVKQAKGQPEAVTIGVCDVKKKSKARNYGVVKIGKDNRVVNFWEKPARPQSSLVAMCLYYFPCSQVGLIKEYQGNPAHSLDAAGAYIGWLIKQYNNVKGVLFKDYWVDIGDIHTYEKVSKPR
ncbi:MAG: nucleotidyltransferase family protein [Candidatus Omnitrophota bacterium]